MGLQHLEQFKRTGDWRCGNMSLGLPSQLIPHFSTTWVVILHVPSVCSVCIDSSLFLAPTAQLHWITMTLSYLCSLVSFHFLRQISLSLLIFSVTFLCALDLVTQLWADAGHALCTEPHPGPFLNISCPFLVFELHSYLNFETLHLPLVKRNCMALPWAGWHAPITPAPGGGKGERKIAHTVRLLSAAWWIVGQTGSHCETLSESKQTRKWH